MNQALLTSLDKKDDDLQLIENTEYGVVVLTSLNVGTEIKDEEETILPTMTTSINIQIARHYFAAHALVFLLIPLFGIVPFYILVTYPMVVSITLVSISSITLVLLYIVLWNHDHEGWTLFPTLIIVIFNNYVFIVALSAAGSTFAPFQGCSILFIEYTTGILIGFIFKKAIDPIWCTLLMMLSGLLMWSVGLYAFIREQDWISSGILFAVCVIIYPLLSGYKVYLINRDTYHTGEILKILCENPLKGLSTWGTNATDSND